MGITNGARRFAGTASAVVLLAGCHDPSRASTEPRRASGSPQLAAAPAVQRGTWSAPFSWPVVAAHLSVLPDGRVLSWTSDDMNHTFNTPNVYVWAPESPATFTQVPNSFTDVFCSAHSFLPDGRLLIMGGHIEDDAGPKDANVFNYQGATWGRLTQMRAGRWYPTSATMGTGEVVVVAGADEHHHANPFPEVWDGSKFRLLGGAPLAMPYYPWLHLAPDGRLFNAGPETQTRYLNPSGDGEWTNYKQTSGGVYREYGTSVMYEPGKLLIVGGGEPPVNTAEVVDLNAGTEWKATGSMQYARKQLNATVLADGRVLVTGGTAAPGFNTESGSVLPAEIWDPATGAWTTLASMKVGRTYHSTAVLLPDGRVLSAGGGRCGSGCTDHKDAEIFAPPYLYNTDGSAAVRPTITSAPPAVDLGQAFTVGTPDAASIARVTLVRLPSTTHGFHMNQGFTRLTFTPTVGGLTVTAPADANRVPAGHYMLFILNGGGVPSVAKIVQVRGTAAAPAPPPPPSAPTSLTAGAVIAHQINLRWADNSTNESAFRIERCQGTACTGYAEIGTVAANITSYVDAGLTAGATYGYRVRASNSAGFSAFSNAPSATPSATSVPTGPVVNRPSARCMDVPGESRDNLTQLIIWDCHRGANQLWTAAPIGSTGEMRVYSDKCLEGNSAVSGGTDGDRVVINDCNGRANQQWKRTTAGEIQNSTGSKCIDLTNKSTANGSGLVLWSCDGSASQKWDFPAAANQAPVASFTFSCNNGLTCTFANTSSDADGTIASSSWTFGDGTSSTTVSPSHTYPASGSYPVTLTTLDDRGASNSATKTVTVSAASPPIALTARGYKVKGAQRVDLSWSGATGTMVDLRRNGAAVALTANDGAYVDAINQKGSGTYRYRVCEAGSTSVCSGEVAVVF